MKVGVIANFSAGLLNFRKELFEELIIKGHEVVIMYPFDDRNHEFTEMGCSTVDTPMSRRGMNPINDISYFRNLYTILKKEKFEYVLTYTIKPNIYGGLATRFLKTPTIINITGLGTMFERTGILQKMIVQLYKMALKGNKHIIFQNEANFKVFEKNNLVKSKYTIVPGSGVNINRFEFHPIVPTIPTNFLYLGRVMEEKGIEELLEAFSSSKINKNARLKIIGFIEDGYKGKLLSVVDESKRKIEYVEFTNDPRKNILESEVVINPSYHEGMSNVLLESGSMGRVLLASDIPGCKEIVENGFNGFLFEPRSSESIIEKVNEYMLLSEDKKKEMGVNSRLKIEKEFNRTKVIQEYLKIMEENK